ncbi:MAG: amidohydrolase family protein [Candidatus Solibacter sp.]
MRDGFHVFDTHTHIGSARHSGRSLTAAELLGVMDTHGIDRSLAIPFPVVDDWRREHDLIGRAVKEHPDRLMGAACLSPYLPEGEFKDEVRRCRQEYGFRALKLQPQYHGLNPFSNASDFFFETAIENHMVVVCHTGSGLPFSLPSLCMMPARKFPELTIVVAHCGGGIFVHEAILAAIFCRNIVLELSTLMPHQILEVLNQVPADRLMAGSDLPENTSTEIGKILTLPISDNAKRSILSGTACRVFGGS